MATDIGTSIKRARERKRWTQRQLADALKVNIKTVDNWENGRTSPRSSVGALEHVLGVSLSDEDTGPPPMSEQLKRAMREELGDERAARLIAHDEHLASGRTSAGPASARPESGRTDRRTAG